MPIVFLPQYESRFLITWIPSLNMNKEVLAELVINVVDQWQKRGVATSVHIKHQEKDSGYELLFGGLVTAKDFNFL